MDVEKQTKLAKMLYRVTKNGNLKWGETSNENKVQTTVSKHVIQLEKHTRSRGEFDFIITVINKSGTIIDQFDDNTIGVEGSDYTDMYTEYKELWGIITRKISGADEALDEILKGLNEIDEIPS